MLSMNVSEDSFQSMFKYMSFDKSADVRYSEQFRHEGNKLFSEGKFFGAIAQYNKALMCARNHKKLAAFCYGNRSAVYLELKYFKHCLHNIELAEPNFPHDKIYKLRNRRERCMDLMRTEKDQSMKAFEHEFKLSYEANPKIPFFIDALELRDDPKIGKHMITTRDLKAGDVIAVIDKPWRIPVSNLNANFVLGCYTCSDTNNGDLIPGKCRALFCSKACKVKHDRENFNHMDFFMMENLHEEFLNQHFPSTINASMLKFIVHMIDVCGGTKKLRKLVDDHRNKNYTVFDFDWSGIDEKTYYKYMLLSMINGMPDKKVDHCPEYLFAFLRPRNRIMTMMCDTDTRELVNELWKKILHQNYLSPVLVCKSRYDMVSYAHPAMNLTGGKHCDPNVTIHTNRRAVVFTVVQPIKAGNVIRSSHNPFYLHEGKHECFNPGSCEPCRNDWKKKLGDQQLASTKMMWNFFDHCDSKQLSSQLDQVQTCAATINENFDSYFIDVKKTSLIVTSMLRLMYTLKQIGNPFPISNLFLSLISRSTIEDRDKLLKKMEFKSD